MTDAVALPAIEVDVLRAPDQRWNDLAPYADAMRELLAVHLSDLGDLDQVRGAVAGYADRYVSAEHRAEIDAIATMAKLDSAELLVMNVYYDMVKHVLGCTAFAIDGPNGPIHARNLDWLTRHNALARHSIVVRYLRGAELLFESVTWPGFIGTLSGNAPGRFSVTLNAVLSDDPPGSAEPVSLVLRSLLSTASYADAIAMLSTCALSCDCLLLVVGIENGQRCVIERTPTRAALRHADASPIVVTNDYRALTSNAKNHRSVLEATSCGRFDRATSLLASATPQSADDCFRYLNDKHVRMDMTVQQMVMSPAQGWLCTRDCER